MMRVKNVQTLLEEDIFRVKEKRYVTDYLSRDRNDLMSYEKGVGVFDGLCDFGQSLWNQYQNGEDIDLLEAAVVDFGAGTIGSLAEQIISGDGIDIGDALYDGVMNTVEGLAFGKQSVKGLGDAIKRGAKAGAATSIVDNIHNAVTGGSGTGAGAGFGMLGLGINSGLSQMQSRDPKTACGSTNPFSSGINFNGSNGYQNWIANGSGNRTGNGFSLVATLGDIVNDTIWGGVGSAAQYGGGKLVEGLENFVSKRWNKSGTSSGKTDFYVTPSGDAIPSTGYRYTARNVNVIQSARRGSVAARRDGTYFSFDKMDDAIIAQGKLQIPYRPEYRIEFDTLDIIDDISIPKGNWGRANYLEPITKDFRIYGPGKATQAITYSEINSVTGIYKMR